VVGVAFALLGIVCIAYGEQRRISVDRAVRQGEFARADPRLTLAITASGVLMGVALIALITLSP